MIESIGIVGAGTMGNGIAQVCAAAGLNVTMADISDASLTRGMSVVVTAGVRAATTGTTARGRISPSRRPGVLLIAPQRKH